MNMELVNDPLTETSAPEANLHNEHLLPSDSLSPLEVPLDGIVQGIEATEQNSGLELKLDLYIPAPPIIEPITPVEETVELCVLPVATEENDTQPEEVKEGSDGTEQTGNVEDFQCENLPGLDESRTDNVIEVQCEVESNETASADCKTPSSECSEPKISNKTPNKPKSSGCKVYNTDRKNIPPKKDKFNPLKLDMAKVIPLTSSQISLQCLECHIIFSDSKSKDRHLKMSHPEEYQQSILGDAVFTCYVCDQHFTCSSDLMAHQRTHTGSERFKCPFCSEAFYRSSELTSHKKKIHYSKHGYTCTECGKPFKTFTLLRYHQRVHTEEKPHVCPHKHCGKKFSAPKSLKNHLEKHQQEDGKGDQTGASTTVKKKRNKGTSERKFPCSQCSSVFKTSKAHQLHIKNKHSQESQSNSVLGPQPKINGPTLTPNGQPQTLLMNTVGSASQQMAVHKLDAEQIKRIIEKLGNVQKVNQLVILPLQPQSFGPPRPHSLMQPLHVNFTESTIQPTQIEQSNTDTSNTQNINLPFSTEMGGLQQETVVLTPQEKNSSESTETQVTPVQLTQMDEIQLELIPIQPETSVLMDQSALQVEVSQNESVHDMAHTADEHVKLTQGNEALKTHCKPSLFPEPETEKSQNVEANAAFETKAVPPVVPQPEIEKCHYMGEDSMPADTVASEETVTNAEIAHPAQMQDSTDLLVGSDSQLVSEHGDKSRLSVPQDLIQDPKAQESKQEPSLVEPQSLLDSLISAQNNTLSSVSTVDQTTANLQHCIFVQKKLPAKRKRSKKQLFDELEPSDGQVALAKKVKTSSKVITKKKEKTKNKKLVVRFGPSEKTKTSKPKVMKTSKTKPNQNQQISSQDQMPILSQHEHKLDSNQKVQKDKKVKGVESLSEVSLTSVCEINNTIEAVLVAPVVTHQGKPQRRKIKNQNNLVKKAKSIQESQQNKMLVPVEKKKKQAKESVDNCPNKPKVRKTKKDDFQKNTHKLAKRKGGQVKSRPDVPNLAHIEKQALLLLKGHKQPQLKVHKLDATELEKSPPNKNDKKVMQKTKNPQGKSLNGANQKKIKTGETKLLEYHGEPLSFEMPSVEDSPGCGSPKPKVARKRKAPEKTDQEIALSPPYSQLTLGCQDCGKTFSEVSALQEHMAAWHSAGKVNFPDETVNVAQKRAVKPSPNEKRILPNVFEIHVATDWDMESEVGENVGERLSFPALSPSPSLTLASAIVEEKEQEGVKNVEGKISGFEEQPEKDTLDVCEIKSLNKSTVPQDTTEKGSENMTGKEKGNEVSTTTEPCIELTDAAEGEIKEELPLEVNLVLVGEQNEEENHSTQTSGVSQECENELSNSCSQPQESLKDSDVVVTQNLLIEPEIKQEEEEVLVRRVDDYKRVKVGNSVKKGKKGVGRARGKKTPGRRTSTENRSKKDLDGNKDLEECQVLYQMCVLDAPERNKKEMDKNGFNSSELSQPLSSEETAEEQVVFELDSVTTSVMDIVNSEEGSFETSKELVRDGSSPGIILEKFLTARERNMENANIQSQIRQTNSNVDTSKVTSNQPYNVKIEERSTNLAHHNLVSSESGSTRGVQMFFVKAEDNLNTNEMFQALQLPDPNHVTSQDKGTDMDRHGISSDSHAMPLQTYSKQCIFYPVKEEERELLVESPNANQTCLDSEELPGASSAIEEIRVDSIQVDMQHLYTNSEEGDCNAELQRTQGFLEFFSENSDTDEADNVHSEPEAETVVMSCYHGIQSTDTVQQNGMERCGSSGRINVPTSATSCKEERQHDWKPINYFNQYFNVDTWNEIAICTQGSSKLPNPVTEKEVAKYVGIHIAMGTLKFPSTKLYWEDYTRVPLISDAMSASRFCELARKLQLVSSGGSSTLTSDHQQSEERNKDQPGQSNEAQSDESAHNYTNSKTDPLWKVMTLIRRVQDGCRELKRSGSFGVDQYPLPFQRHPTHSLLHTVVTSAGGLVVDFSLSVDHSSREKVVEKMVSRGKDRNEGMVFLCKPELSTPSMLEHLLEAGVQSAGKVGGARGQIGDEFVSSDGKLKLFRCHHGFILSAVVKEKPRSTSLVSGFERAIKAANLNRDLRSLYRTPCTNSSVSAWPQSVLWDLIDLVLVNAWIQYKQDYAHITDLLSLMAFRLEVAKALILSSGVDAQDSSPPCPPAPKLHGPDTNSKPSQVMETPLPNEQTRYDGFGHWPEQLAEGEEAGRCRFGGCERTSRVRCLKCCVFLCISRNHNCFLKFHSQGFS